jgi:hypothetical protein
MEDGAGPVSTMTLLLIVALAAVGAEKPAGVPEGFA